MWVLLLYGVLSLYLPRPHSPLECYAGVVCVFVLFVLHGVDPGVLYFCCGFVFHITKLYICVLLIIKHRVMDEFRFLQIIEELRKAKYPDLFLAYVSLQWQSGSRISDLLRVDYSCISPHLQITIEQGKGSKPLIVQPVHFRDLWRVVRDSRLSPARNWSRFFFYRVYKRYGIVIKSDNLKYDSVTHSFRKYIADDIIAGGGTIEDVQQVLGHIETKSAKYYVNESERIAVLNRGLLNTVSGAVDPFTIDVNGVIRMRTLNVKRGRK